MFGRHFLPAFCLLLCFPTAGALVARAGERTMTEQEVKKYLDEHHVTYNSFRDGDLSLQSTEIQDLSPLRGLPLKSLNLCRTKVTDLRPLQGMPLTKLDLSGTKVTDLSPLHGLPLVELHLEWTPIKDFSPLQGTPLKTLHFLSQDDSKKVKGLDVLRGIPTLEAVGGGMSSQLVPPELFLKVYEAGRWSRDFVGETFHPQAEEWIELTDKQYSAFPVKKVSDGFPLGTWPRVDGSTSTQPLAMLIACRMTGSENCWWPWSDRLLLAATSKPPNETPEARHERVMQTLTLNEQIQHTGTNTAYVALIEGKKDLILEARAPSEDELKLAGKKGVQLELRAVALDAFVFIVNKENPVEALTSEQIRAIFTGRTANWKDLGGPDQPVHPLQREPNSGSQELMERLVMKGTAMVKAEEAVTYGMFGPFNKLAKDKLALAYTVFFYQGRMAILGKETKLVAVDGVMPEAETIRARQYPYTAEVYVVIRRDAAEKSQARKLRDWMLSPAGQEVVAESGYVPMPPSELAAAVALAPASVPAYRYDWIFLLAPLGGAIAVALLLYLRRRSRRAHR